MNRTITSWLVSIFAGVIVGVFGGFLALKGMNATSADVTVAGSEGMVPGGVIPASSEASPVSVSPPSLSDTISADNQEEVRQAVNQALEEGRRTAIVIATERVHAAVVTVFVTERITTRSIFPDIFSDFFTFGTPSTGQREGLGSGVIISEDGYILTNAHVVENADNITVRFTDGTEFTGVVIDTDPRRDLAVLKIDPPDDIPVAKMGDSRDIMIGEWVIALGSPFGFMINDPQPSVSVGVVSAVGRSFITTSEGKLRYFPSTIQTDAAINPGNSGGPLVNTLGEVVGINSFIFSQSGGSVGIGFAIPINQAKEALEQIRIYGHIRRAWIGLQTDDNNWYYVRRFGVRNERGILVTDVEQHSPAEEAGFKNGALIVALDGEEMRSNRALETIMLKAEIGDTMTIEFYPHNSTRKRSTTLTVGEEPPGKPKDTDR